MPSKFSRQAFYALLFMMLLALTVAGQAPQQAAVQELLPAQTLEREMSGGETHRFQFNLQKDEFFKANVEQKSINVSLRLYDAKGNELAEADSCLNKGFEALTFVADTAGKFVLEVKNLDDKGEKGSYVIHREASRGATPEDRREVVIQREQQAKRDQLETLIQEVPQLVGTINPSTSARDFQTAISKATQALEIAQSTKCLKPEALFLFITGRMYEEKGDKQKALEYYEKTLKVINTDENIKKSSKFMEVKTLRNMGRIYEDDLRNSEEAAKLFYRGLSLYQENEEDEDKGILLRDFGNTLEDFRFYQQAEESLLKALKVFQNLKLQFEAGATLGNLGRVYLNQGDKPAKALEYFLESEKLLENSPVDSEYQQIRLYNLGYIHMLYENLHDPEKAEIYRNKAKELESKTKEPYVAFVNKFLLGKALVDAGRPEEALRVYQEALDLAKNSLGQWDPTTAQTQVLEQMIYVYLVLGKYEEANKSFDKAYELLNGLNDHTELAILLEKFADFLAEGQAFELAAKYYYQAVSVLMSKEKRPPQVNFEQIARVQNKWGKAQLEIGEQSGALTNLHTSLLIQISLYQQTELANMLADRMSVFARLNKSKLAIFFGKQAVALKQEMRRGIKSFPIDTQKSFLRGNRRTYEKLVALLLQEGRYGEAIQIINFYQDQEFYDFDNNERTLNKGISFTERERTALAELGRLQSSLRASKEKFLDNPDFDKLDALITQIETDFSKPSDDKDKPPAVPDLTDMQTALNELGTATRQRAAALYTVISNEKFHIVLITPDGDVKAFASAITAEDLNKRVLAFYALLQSPNYDPRPLGKELYDIIFKPIEAELKKSGAQTLMWQLDGNLRYIPMAALWDGEKYLVERYQNVVFTRASREQMTRNVSQSWTGVGFGGSQARTVDLLGDGDKINFVAIPGVTAELQAIFRTNDKAVGILNGEVFADEKFTKNAFYEAIKRRRPLVHISSHFAFRPGDDSRSFLLLGDGTALTLNEIKKQENLFAGVEMLTLSACNTAATQPNANGKEIDGFAELAQRLGASAVMATLWQVSDSSTSWLMQEFYSTRQSKSGTTKAESLRYAQLALLNGTANTKFFSDVQKGSRNSNLKVVVIPDASKQTRDLTRGDIVYISGKDAPLFKRDDKKPFAHPYYWSPFVLYGNWR